MCTPQINLLVFRTSQPKTLAKFYELLGMEFQYHQHGNGPFHYAATLNGFVFEIYPLLKNQQEVDKSLRLGFTVPQLDQLILELKKNKIEIIKEPTQMEWGYIAIIRLIRTTFSTYLAIQLKKNFICTD